MLAEQPDDIFRLLQAALPHHPCSLQENVLDCFGVLRYARVLIVACNNGQRLPLPLNHHQHIIVASKSASFVPAYWMQIGSFSCYRL